MSLEGGGAARVHLFRISCSWRDKPADCARTLVRLEISAHLRLRHDGMATDSREPVFIEAGPMAVVVALEGLGAFVARALTRAAVPLSLLGGPGLEIAIETARISADCPRITHCLPGFLIEWDGQLHAQ